MTVELACRLLEGKVLLRTEVASALEDACGRGVSLVQALVERVPGAVGILESEFARWSGPVETVLEVDEPLYRELPLGMCERFLALPLLQRGPAGAVPLAVVDPFDRHVLAEFEFCLSAAVTPVRASYPVLIRALENLRQLAGESLELLLDVPDDETPAFGTRMLRTSWRVQRDRSSNVSTPASRRGLTVPSVEVPPLRNPSQKALARDTLAPPGHIEAASDPPDLTPLPAGVRRDSEPVLRLVKQKPVAVARRISIPAPPRFAEQGVERPEVVLESLERVKSPRELIERLHEALGRLAPCQAYFAVSAGRYVLQWATGVEGPGQDGSSSVPVLTPEQESLLGKACQAGYFLGPLPPDGSARALGAALGLRAREEIYAVPVNVADRPALVIIVGRFDEAFAVTRWVDSIATRAGHVLRRLAREKKRG